MKGKKILLGICGSIAAYKAAYLIRLLIKAGCEVQVIMTPSSRDFITATTISTLSKRPVLSDISSDGQWSNHVSLGLWADAFIIAPATANTIAKMANGCCDNLLLAVYLSARCPVYVAPAMDLDMWRHPATKNNIATLKKHDVKVINVNHGELASGLTGDGRMSEPDEIFELLNKDITCADRFKGKKILVTAGPTFEAIDPVRFIGNHSSGKMGCEIALALAEQSANVFLVLGPSEISVNHPNIKVTQITTAAQMHQASVELFPKCNAAILSAAVADFRPKKVSPAKIKKTGNKLPEIRLERTEDIAMTLNEMRKDDQFIIGFALETNEETKNAQSKLKRKKFDFIVLNSLRDKGAGFRHDTNKVTIMHKDNKIQKYKLLSKQQVARNISEHLYALFINLPKND